MTPPASKNPFQHLRGQDLPLVAYRMNHIELLSGPGSDTATLRWLTPALERKTRT